MTPGALWQISVATLGEAEEAVAVLLEDLFHLPAAICSTAGGRRARVTVYAPALSAWNAGCRAALEAGLARIRECGLDIGAGRIDARRLRRAAWAESWRRHFRPLAIGGRLLIKPSWSRRRARAGQAVIVLDPGLSFGTGHHPTTAFCLGQLVAAREPGTRQSVLDVGTGSGILAIAAARLGYAPVRAWDNDPQAVRAARENARANGVEPQVAVRQADLARLPAAGKGRYDLVLANLDADLLVAAARRLVRWARPGGALVLAGVLTAEFRRVQQGYAAAGWRVVAAEAKGGWRSGVFRAGKKML